MDYLLDNFFQNRSRIELIKEPTYIYFPYALKQNIREFNRLIEADVEIFYAVKANNYSKLVKELVENNFGFDIATKEELEYIINLGGDVSKITFSAPSKKSSDIEYALKAGVKYYAFDSEVEIDKICKIAHTQKITDFHLCARMAASNKDAVFNLSDKFGMTKEYFRSLMRKAVRNKWPIHGITFHVGSQNLYAGAWKKSIESSLSLINEYEELGGKIDYINLGGGIPANYNSETQDLEYYVSLLIKYVVQLRKLKPNIKVMIEPGRAMCANTMVLVCRVIDIKNYKKPPTIIVDTGVFNGMIEPLEHFEYPLYRNLYGKTDMKYYRIAGFTCEGYDVLNNRALLPKKIRLGDPVIFEFAGAYTFVYSKFHMVDYPEIKDNVYYQK